MAHPDLARSEPPSGGVRSPASLGVGYKYASHNINGLQAKAIKAAGRILENEGLERLNLRAIADDAGIGIASMYHYFKNKDEILLNVALAGYEELRREMLRAAGQGDPSPSRSAGQAFFAFAERRPALFAVMGSASLQARYQVLRDAHHRMFQAYEAAVMSDDRIPEAHRQNVAYVMCAFGHGLATMMASQPDGVLPPETAERIRAGLAYLVDREG